MMYGNKFKYVEDYVMFDILVSRMMLRIVSILLGGIGMFYLFMSFTIPDFAGTAIVLIAAAGAIVYFCKE